MKNPLALLRSIPWKTVRNAVWKFVRRRWKLLLLLAIILLPSIALGFFLFGPEKPEYITAEAVRGDLIQSVEAVGTVISEKDLELKFPVTGVVEEVYVKEGDTVEADHVLAELRNNSLEADLSSASASYQAALADLRALEEGTRPEEIAIAEAEVENKRAALAAARATLENAERSLGRSQSELDQLHREAETSLSGYVSTAGSTISQELTDIENSLNELDDYFDTTVIKNAVEFRSRLEFEVYVRKREEAGGTIADALLGSRPADFEEATENLEVARDAALHAVTAADDAYTIIVALPTSNYLTTATKETYKDSAAGERNSIQSALNDIEDQLKATRDASANFSTEIATEESAFATAQGIKDKALADIMTYETSLRVQEAQLALKKAGARQADIDAARAAANRAYAGVRYAQARLDDTVLKAPIAGRITKVNLKAGEFTGDFEDFNRAITMLGDSPYRVEMFVSEIDIPKVQYEQEGGVELDAYPGRDFLLQVTEIDPAATLVDGVPKYRIKLDFLEDEEKNLKIGMTGDVEIITGVQKDVTMVPGRSVIKNVLGQDIVRILHGEDEIEERAVVVGMESDTDVEIISGAEEGEKVIILIKE
ncbi:MAG TPA: efflux RND transporter periplasmic adaptor subunit [Candidatus Peribacteraceae bacterium]|nr:efflux RND transporter periplasmic adaptor subunit [Candidatus Peribacteraceae bacterium]